MADGSDDIDDIGSIPRGLTSMATVALPMTNLEDLIKFSQESPKTFDRAKSESESTSEVNADGNAANGTIHAAEA